MQDPVNGLVTCQLNDLITYLRTVLLILCYDPLQVRLLCETSCVHETVCIDCLNVSLRIQN